MNIGFWLQRRRVMLNPRIWITIASLLVLTHGAYAQDDLRPKLRVISSCRVCSDGRELRFRTYTENLNGPRFEVKLSNLIVKDSLGETIAIAKVHRDGYEFIERGGTGGFLPEVDVLGNLEPGDYQAIWQVNELSSNIVNFEIYKDWTARSLYEPVLSIERLIEVDDRTSQPPEFSCSFVMIRACRSARQARGRGPGFWSTARTTSLVRSVGQAGQIYGQASGGATW
jgi:hypothetical protein